MWGLTARQPGNRAPYVIDEGPSHVTFFNLKLKGSSSSAVVSPARFGGLKYVMFIPTAKATSPRLLVNRYSRGVVTGATYNGAIRFPLVT